MQTLITILIDTVAVFATAYVLPGVRVAGFLNALVVAVMIAVVNAIVRPILVFLTFPITIVTFGLFLLVINALMILLVSAIVPGFTVKNFGWALLFSIILTIVNSVLNSLIK